MQLASTGARALQGHASNILTRGARAIHIPTRAPAPSTTQRIVSTTRTLLSRFVGHLATPGAFSSPPAGAAHIGRGFTNAARAPTIQQGFSLPLRQALQPRPIYLPRAPAVPRSVAQVGLGTARNFSSGRPIFQNLVQNVPIAGRAFSELDMDSRMKMEQRRARVHEKKKGGERARMGTLKEGVSMKKAQKVSAEEEDRAAEMEHYFAAPQAEAEVTTYLLVPLAPTPTARMPLPLDVPDSSVGRLLAHSSLAAVGDIHAAHERHGLRVSALFARLDAGKVWERGASSEAYGEPGGACTVLRVEFRGWTAGAVRGVIGESGTGWCALEEVRHVEDVDSVLDDGDALSDIAPIHATIDPAQSFVLPTLDFSSSFVAANTAFSDAFPTWSSPPNQPLDWSDDPSDSTSDSDGTLADYLSDSDSDGMSDVDRLSDDGTESWARMSFSSSFSERMGEPRYLF